VFDMPNTTNAADHHSALAIADSARFDDRSKPPSTLGANMVHAPQAERLFGMPNTSNVAEGWPAMAIGDSYASMIHKVHAPQAERVFGMPNTPGRQFHQTTVPNAGEHEHDGSGPHLIARRD
jgi:hypothetical protein